MTKYTNIKLLPVITINVYEFVKESILEEKTDTIYTDTDFIFLLISEKEPVEFFTFEQSFEKLCFQLDLSVYGCQLETAMIPP